MVLISIVIPLYNRAKLIGETIESVLNQTYSNWELIIVDDGSTDNSDEVIKPFLVDSRIKFLNRPVDRAPGGNAARNFGFESSRGDYIKWLDSDDLLLPKCLELQVHQMLEVNSDVCFCRSRFFFQESETGKIVQGSYWHENFYLPSNILNDFIFGKIRFSNNDGLWKRKALPDNPYEESLRNSQEFLMISRMLTKDLKVSFIENVLVLIRLHTNQMADSRDYAQYARNQILARYLVMKELKLSGNTNKQLNYYLIKSNLYYITNQIKNKNFKHLRYNISLFLKSINNLT